MIRLLTVLVTVAVLGLLGFVVSAQAGLVSVTSDGSLGPASDYFKFGWGDYRLNTDLGQIRDGGTVIRGGGRLVSQPAGPDIMVFDFTTFTLGEGLRLLIEGSRPCAIAATGNVHIAGAVTVKASGYPGGAGQSYVPDATTAGNAGDGPGHGHGGEGPGALVRNPQNDNDMLAAAGGGGGAGGLLSPGKPGHDGNPGFWQGAIWQKHGGLGGAPCGSWYVLDGGSGGGGGGACYHTGAFGGIAGAAGGGALLVATPGDFVLTAAGTMDASGSDAGWIFGPHGGGGGGAGGFLGFQVGDVWHSTGRITVRGGAGTNDSTGGYSGGGDAAGGCLYIDPTAIINDGVIDMGGGDGAGDPTLLGAIGLDPGTSLSGTGSTVGATVTVPEPGTLVLLVLAGLAAIVVGERAKRDRSDYSLFRGRPRAGNVDSRPKACAVSRTQTSLP